jgi:hypothetical protein
MKTISLLARESTNGKTVKATKVSGVMEYFMVKESRDFQMVQYLMACGKMGYRLV